jgi:hypothetical protein
LEVFRKLKVTGGTMSQRLSFIDELTEVLPVGWKRDQAREADLTRHLGRQLSAFYVTATAETSSEISRPAARLFIAAVDNELEVTNVVPDKVPELTRKQYNSIILDFYRIASPVAGQLKLDLMVTSDELDISELLSPQAWQALRNFSALANKSTGSSHQADRDRWFEFLILQHATEGRLSTGILERWLVEEERWPEDVADKLAIQFEFGTDLLRAYDQQRR